MTAALSLLGVVPRVRRGGERLSVLLSQHLIAMHVDSVLMVVAAGQTQTGALGIALDNIGRSSGNVLGAVLNSVTRETGTGYDYYYKYSGRYGYVPRTPRVAPEITSPDPVLEVVAAVTGEHRP